jgi:hypothetical protein
MTLKLMQERDSAVILKHKIGAQFPAQISISVLTINHLLSGVKDMFYSQGECHSAELPVNVSFPCTHYSSYHKWILDIETRYGNIA